MDLSDLQETMIGCMVVNPNLVDVCTLNADDFVKKKDAMVYTALEDLNDQDTNVDEVTVADELTTRQSDFDWTTLLATRIKQVPEATIDAFKSYQNRVIERLSLQSCREKVQAIDWENVSYEQVQRQIERASENLVIDDGKCKSLIREQEIDQLDDYFEQRKKRGFQEGILTTGFDQIDDSTMGIRRTDEVMVSAETGVGKTTLGLNIIRNIADQGGTGVIYSLEMPRKNLQHRLIARESGVSLNKMYKGGLDDGELTRLRDASQEVKNKEIYTIEDKTTAREIISSAKEITSKYDVDIIMVDYLQELGNHLHQSAKKYQWFESAVKDFKQFSMQHGVPILLIASVNNDGDIYNTSQGKFAVDSHLRLVSVEEENELGQKEDNGKRILKTRKARHGPGGVTKMQMTGDISHITEVQQ